ncbi:MAG: hypothetical protein AB7E79_05310 [Rhodospirillaceae bacterium]
MTTVPPPNVALPQVLAAAAAPTTIVIPQPPPALAAVPVGTTIEAIVTPPPPPPPTSASAQAAAPAPAPTPPANSGVPIVILHTAVGDISVRLPVPLPDKVPLELEVVRASPQQVTVRVITIDGTSALQYLAQSRMPVAAGDGLPSPMPALKRPFPAGPQPLLPGLSWTPGGPAPFVQLGTISAVVTQSPPPLEAAMVPSPPAAFSPSAPAVAASVGPTLASLPIGNGGELSLKIVSVQLPGAQIVAAPLPAGPSAPTMQPASPPPLPMPTPAPAPGSVAPVPAPQPGLVIAGPQGLPPAAPAPPGAVQPAAPIASAMAVVVANVDSIPVVEIEGRQLQLNVRAHLPVGTKIVFDVISATAPRPGAPLALPLPAGSPPLSGPAGAYVGWPTLSESLSVLQRSDPIAAQQLSQVIPDGGPRTAAAVISFVQAMRSGDARQWPGDVTLRALERASPRGAHLAATLSGEVAELSARARETGAEWRALPVPWNAGGQIERVTLVTRREGESESETAKGKKAAGERFLIEVNLSRLGPMQLDGMFKKESRSFDLVMRTKAALPEQMRKDLLGLFADANGAMGLKGGLTFQVTKKFADPLGAGNSPDKSGLWA